MTIKGTAKSVQITPINGKPFTNPRARHTLSKVGAAPQHASA